MIGALQGDTVTKAGLHVTQAQNIQSSMQEVIAVDQIGRLGMELGIDPGLTQIIGLSIGAMQGQFIENPTTSLEKAFANIRPNLLSSLATYGFSEAGGHLGLDPTRSRDF